MSADCRKLATEGRLLHAIQFTGGGPEPCVLTASAGGRLVHRLEAAGTTPWRCEVKATVPAGEGTSVAPVAADPVIRPVTRRRLLRKPGKSRLEDDIVGENVLAYEPNLRALPGPQSQANLVLRWRIAGSGGYRDEPINVTVPFRVGD